MKIAQKIYLVLIFILSLLLAGCLTPVGDNLPANYSFSSKSSEGLIVLSTSCNLGPTKTYLQFLKITDEVSPRYQLSFNCNSSSDVLSEPELKIINLAPGTYYFVDILQYYPTFYTVSPHFKPIYFSVEPGKVRYIGWIQLRAGEGDQYELSILNAKDRDIPWLKQKLPYLKSSMIQVEKPHD